MSNALFEPAKASRRKMPVFIGVALRLCFTPVSAPAARSPVKGTPRLGGGQSIERLVLMETIHIQHPNMRHREAMEFWMLPGQFIPVSEDGEGVYYQGPVAFEFTMGRLGRKAFLGDYT
jgi:hypothetical protein